MLTAGETLAAEFGGSAGSLAGQAVAKPAAYHSGKAFGRMTGKTGSRKVFRTFSGKEKRDQRCMKMMRLVRAMLVFQAHPGFNHLPPSKVCKKRLDAARRYQLRTLHPDALKISQQDLSPKDIEDSATNIPAPLMRRIWMTCGARSSLPSDPFRKSRCAVMAQNGSSPFDPLLSVLHVWQRWC